MSLVDNIEKICKQRGLTFKSLEREAGLGNGTIRRWEVQSPRLDGLLKVANYLHLTLDELVSDSSETAMLCDGEPLSEDEADLIDMYRLLEGRDKEDIFELTRLKYGRVSGEREVSVYSTYTGESEPSETEKSDPGEGGKTASGIA